MREEVLRGVSILAMECSSPRDQMHTKAVLVVGDLMVDRAWVVTGRVQETVQAHSDVKPLKRAFPCLIADRLGGAGLTASAIKAKSDCGAEVHLLATYRDIDKRTLEGVTLHRIRVAADSQLTTVKWRIYGLNARKVPALLFRFDQDPPADALPKINTAHIRATLGKLDPELVVISDFNKGVVQPQLIAALLTSFPDAEILVDTKNRRLFQEASKYSQTHGTGDLKDRRGTLFLNRSEAGWLWEEYFNKEPPDIFDQVDHCKLEILRLGKDLLSQLPKWKIVIKLDCGGAFAFAGECFAQTGIKTPLPGSGIGAGDFFLAGWASSLLKDRTATLDVLLESANRTARWWVDYSDSVDAWDKARHNGRETVIASDLPTTPLAALGDGISALPEQEIDDAIKLERIRLLYPGCIEEAANADDAGRLVLSRARGGLGSFLVVEPIQRRQLRHFKEAIERYFKDTGETRPLNCLLTASPGTGKSFLINEIARSVQARFYEINISQCGSVDQVLAQLAGIAGQSAGAKILMLDEVDTLVGGNHIYPLLLAPLWDGKVFFGQQEWNLGKRFVSVLIASQRKFLEQLTSSDPERADKGVDLVTRINGPRIELRAPAEALSRGDVEGLDIRREDACRADFAYLVASIVRRYHSEVHWISRDVMDLLCSFRLPPRHLENLLLKVEPRGDSWLRMEDLDAVLKRDEPLRVAERTTSDASAEQPVADIHVALQDRMRRVREGVGIETRIEIIDDQQHLAACLARPRRYDCETAAGRSVPIWRRRDPARLWRRCGHSMAE